MKQSTLPYTHALLPALVLLLLLGGCRQQVVVMAKSSGLGGGAAMINFLQPITTTLQKQGIALRADTTTRGNGQALDALVQGRAQATIIGTGVLLANTLDTTKFAQNTELRTLAPGEDASLFIWCHQDLPHVPIDSLVRGRSIYCGAAGSATHRTAIALLDHLGVPPGSYTITGDTGITRVSQNDSIVFAMGNFSLKEELSNFPDHEARSLEDTHGVSLAEGFVADKPFLRVATLPPYTLGPRQPRPVVYLTAQSWTVCRADMPDAVAYELARAFNPPPSANGPTLEEVDLATLPFPLHEGARQYRERDRPSFVQRNAEVLGLLLTIGGLLAAGGGALLARRRRRTSRRFDALYTRVAELELACAEALSPEASAQLAQEVKTLQHQLLHDMAHHHELTEARAALLQQKLSSCLGLLHQTTLLAPQRAQS